MSALLTEQINTGGSLQTASGRQFAFVAPDVDQVSLEDIAHALSHVCRFGGHVRRHYSVAEHSVRVSRICPPDHALAGLLHDSAEAFIGDMPTPLKRLDECRGYVAVERRVEAVIARKFGLASAEMHAEVKRADGILLATEARDLLLRRPLFDISEAPLPGRIRPWSTRRAKFEFLARFCELTGEGTRLTRTFVGARRLLKRLLGSPAVPLATASANGAGH